MKKRTGVQQTGFKPSKYEVIHHVLGGVGDSFPIIRESGNYNDVIPDFEAQSNYSFDTYNCTAFGSLNQIEMYMLAVFGEKVNYSERWVGIIAGTNPQNGGNDPHTVYEAIRKYGLIPDSMLPFNDDIKTAEEYFSFKGGNEAECRAEGKRWLEKYNFNHKWPFTDSNTDEEKINNLKASYKMSPPGFAVYAWQKDARGLYIALASENHWLSSSRYFDYPEGVDSYEPYKKKIDQVINFAKVICITKKTTPSKLSLWQTIINFFKKYVNK